MSFLRIRRTPAVLAVLAVTLAPALAACGGDDDEKTLNVSAAASLTETFEELGKQFEDEHDGVTVKFNFGSSGELADAAVDGAKGDLLATADEDTMQTAVDGDAVDGDPEPFATNKLTLVVPKGNPAKVTSLADLNNKSVRFVICADTAPCGKAAATVLEAGKITGKPVSEEIDVKAVLGQVVDGQADAGLVYLSDARAASDDVDQVDISEAPLQTYPIAVLAQSDDADLAEEFQELVVSEEGQKVLTDAGFGTP